MRIDIAKDRVDLYVKAICIEWGSESQMRMCQEECGELVAAINQFFRGRIGVLELAEEVADVRIMAEQMELCIGLLNVPEVCVADLVEKKLERLRKLLMTDHEGGSDGEAGTP